MFINLLKTSKRSKAIERLTANYGEFEEKIGYTFKNKGYLLQALTHASYQYNQGEILDCKFSVILTFSDKLLPKIGVFGRCRS